MPHLTTSSRPEKRRDRTYAGVVTMLVALVLVVPIGIAVSIGAGRSGSAHDVPPAGPPRSVDPTATPAPGGDADPPAPAGPVQRQLAAQLADGAAATTSGPYSYIDLHRPEDAYPLSEGHIADPESVYLLHDPETALAVVALADTRRVLGDLDGAETGYRRVAELRAPAGDDANQADWVVLQAEAGLAVAAGDRGDPRAAATRLTGVRWHGWRDYDTLRMAANLAGLRLLHDPDGVRDLTDVAYPKAGAVFGATHWLARHLASLAEHADRHPRPARWPPAPPVAGGDRQIWLVVLAVLLACAAVVAGALFGRSVGHGALSAGIAVRPPAVSGSGWR
jgi:hypothetical protein